MCAAYQAALDGVLATPARTLDGVAAKAAVAKLEAQGGLPGEEHWWPGSVAADVVESVVADLLRLAPPASLGLRG